MSRMTATQAARCYLIRNYGCFLVTMSEASRKQLIRAYIAGHYNGKRSKRNGSKK
jgi:hypothetical protein